MIASPFQLAEGYRASCWWVGRLHLVQRQIRFLGDSRVSADLRSIERVEIPGTHCGRRIALLPQDVLHFGRLERTNDFRAQPADGFLRCSRWNPGPEPKGRVES